MVIYIKKLFKSLKNILKAAISLFFIFKNSANERNVSLLTNCKASAAYFCYI